MIMKDDKMKKTTLLFILCHLLFAPVGVLAQSVVDEVVWVVGDEPILRSDVEVTRIQAAMEGVKWSGNPDCAIPEQLAVQ